MASRNDLVLVAAAFARMFSREAEREIAGLTNDMTICGKHLCAAINDIEECKPQPKYRICVCGHSQSGHAGIPGSGVCTIPGCSCREFNQR